MTHCFIVSSHQEFLNTTAQFVAKYTYYKSICVLIKGDNYREADDLFAFIVDKFTEVSFSDLRESVVLVDEYFDLKNCQPIALHCDSNNFWGRMILAFPELEFIFQNPGQKGTKGIGDWIENESREEKDRTFIPLFDHTGLRSQIREIINASQSNKDNSIKSWLQVRTLNARVIEDELFYTYFHGYIAFKRHYNCKLYTSLNHLEQDRDQTEVIDLQIQDLSLGFIDKREDVHLSMLPDRYRRFPFLKHVVKRKDFAITTGQQVSMASARYLAPGEMKKCLAVIDLVVAGSGVRNSFILRDKHEGLFFTLANGSSQSPQPVCKYCGLDDHNTEFCVELIYKPTKGMYAIESRLKLEKVNVKEVIDETDKGGHSAPGILTMLAEHLISRSQNILDNAKQVSDAIHAATLALEAKELLNGLTPTLALQALSLQHEAEVLAECLFVGTEYNIELTDRFLEIDSEVRFISKKFTEKQQKRVCLDTQLSIIQTLSGTYGSYKQFEEELECLKLARQLQFKISARKSWWSSLFHFILFKPIEFSLRSGRNFMISIFFVQLIYGLFYFLFAIADDTATIQTSFDAPWGNISILWQSLISAIKYFFTSETTKTFETIFAHAEPYSNILLATQGFLSLASLSTLMALVFLRLSRK